MDSETATWVDGYKAAMASYLARRGYLAEDSDGRRSYSDPWDYSTSTELHEHAATCAGWRITGDFVDFEWQEFQGTFASEPWGTRTALKATVTCGCGRYADAPVHVQATLSEAVQAVLAEAERGQA